MTKVRTKSTMKCLHLEHLLARPTEAQRAQRLTEEKRSIVSVLCGCSLCPLCLCGESDARGFLPHDRDLDARRVPGGVPDAMSLGPKIRRLRPEDVGDAGLRVAVVQREPGALDLHHDLVAPLERIGLLVQVHREVERGVGLE